MVRRPDQTVSYHIPYQGKRKWRGEGGEGDWEDNISGLMRASVNVRSARDRDGRRKLFQRMSSADLQRLYMRLRDRMEWGRNTQDWNETC